MKFKFNVEKVPVDAGIICISDEKYYSKYEKKEKDSWLSKTFDIEPGTYDVKWRIRKTWNGDIQGSGIIKIWSGNLVVSDPCYLIENWDEWIKNTNIGDDAEDGTILIDKMGGDGEYCVELELEKIDEVRR